MQNNSHFSIFQLSILIYTKNRRTFINQDRIFYTKRNKNYSLQSKGISFTMRQQKRLFLPNLLDKLGTFHQDISPRHSDHLHTTKPQKTQSFSKKTRQNQSMQHRQSLSILLNNLPQSKENQLLSRLLQQNYSKHRKQKKLKTQNNHKQESFQKKYNLQMNYLSSNLNVHHIDRSQKSQMTNKNVSNDKKFFSIKTSLLTKENFNVYHQKVIKKFSFKGDGKQNNQKQASQKIQNKINFLKKLKPLNELSSKLFSQHTENVISRPRQHEMQKHEIRQCFSQMRKNPQKTEPQNQNWFHQLKVFEGNILPWENQNNDTQKEESFEEIFVNQE